MAINGSTTPRFCLPLLVFTCLALGSASMPAASSPPEASSISLRGTLASVYNSWSAYDELSDNIELTETLAMKELKEILRLRRAGVRIDYYLNGIN